MLFKGFLLVVVVFGFGFGVCFVLVLLVVEIIRVQPCARNIGGRESPGSSFS